MLDICYNYCGIYVQLLLLEVLRWRIHFQKVFRGGPLDPTFLFTKGFLYIIKCLISPSLKEINNAVTVSSVNTLLLTSSAFNRKIYLIQTI